MWSEGGLKLAGIVTNNSRENELNTRLGYAMVNLAIDMTLVQEK